MIDELEQKLRAVLPQFETAGVTLVLENQEAYRVAGSVRKKLRGREATSFTHMPRTTEPFSTAPAKTLKLEPAKTD